MANIELYRKIYKRYSTCNRPIQTLAGRLSSCHLTTPSYRKKNFPNRDRRQLLAHHKELDRKRLVTLTFATTCGHRAVTRTLGRQYFIVVANCVSYQQAQHTSSPKPSCRLLSIASFADAASEFLCLWGKTQGGGIAGKRKSQAAPIRQLVLTLSARHRHPSVQRQKFHQLGVSVADSVESFFTSRTTTTKTRLFANIQTTPVGHHPTICARCFKPSVWLPPN